MGDALFDRWPEAERILDEVLDLEPPERRQQALDRCRGDEALRTLVEQLLDADADVDALPAEPKGVIADLLSEEDDLPGRVGPFRVERELGRGGMGRVLLGRREEADGQGPALAIKLLSVAAPSPTARNRFARERATLARLRHPNIARLYDAGVTDAGAPYLVMEYVEGRALDVYCDERALDLTARLALFRQVCLAVEYAHSQFIVHRDLKPANVLVDAFGQVKLLDFGIAKSLDALDEDGALTQTVHRALTPAHAAPEQFRGEPVTTATDVYQLGLLLYRLLTGKLAHGAATSTPDELRSAVLETDPERPSRVAADPVLGRRLQGDLDAVVLKALRKEPAERYATVEALRRDLDNVLAHRPVSARRDTPAYVFRKYVRRHHVAVSAVAAVTLSLTVGLTVVSRQSQLIAAERDRAQAAEARASAINAFLVNDLLTAATPERAGGVIPTVDAVLDMAARSVNQAFEGQPALAAEVQLTLARSYASLGKLPQARRHASEAAAILDRSPGPDQLAALRAKALVTEMDVADGRFADARAELEGLISVQTAVAGPEHVDTLWTRALLARALRGLGEPSAAEQEIRQVMTLAAAAHPGDRRLGIELRSVLIDIIRTSPWAMEAEAVVDEAVALARQQYGDAHPRTINLIGLRAAVLTQALKYREAIGAQQEHVDLSEEVYGPDHPLTGRAHMGLAVAITRLHGNASAEAHAPITRSYEILRRTLGDDHPETLQALRNLGIWNRYSGNLDEAERIARLVYDARRRTLGGHHRSTLEAARSVATVLDAARRADAASDVGRDIVRAFAEATARPDADPVLLDDFAVYLLDGQPSDVRDPARALTVAERAVAATGRRDYLRLRTLAQAYRANGSIDAAIATLREALALPDAILSWTQERLLVELMHEHSAPAELEAWLLERLEQYPKYGRSDDVAVARTLRHLGDHYLRAGRIADAERRLAEALAQIRKTADDGHFEVAEAKVALGDAMARREMSAEAERLLEEGMEAMLADYRAGPRARAAAHDRVVAAYERWGRTADATRWRGRSLQ
jgi:tRNA A-37 threonylcarbamoyl transferase component Bud32